MTAADFKRHHETIGCTGEKLAEWMVVSPVTITRWRTGTNPIPGPAALAIRALASGWRP